MSRAALASRYAVSIQTELLTPALSSLDGEEKEKKQRVRMKSQFSERPARRSLLPLPS